MTDQLLPDVLSGMDTAPGITDEELKAIWLVYFGDDKMNVHQAALAAMRAVASRTRPATPAPDAMAEALAVMKPFAELWKYYGETDSVLRCYVDAGRASRDLGPDAFARAHAFIARHTGEK